MIANEAVYWKYIDKYGVFNEWGELIGFTENAPEEAKESFEEERIMEEKKRKKAEKEGYILS